MSDLEVVSFRPEPGQYAWTFGGAAPAMRIRTPAVLEVYTEDCFAGRVRSEQDLVSQVCEFPYLNPQTGPFHIEGAEPGDTVAVTLGLGLKYTPTVAFAMVGTGLVIVLVAIYILMNAACIGFFARRGRSGFNWLSHLIIPLLGIAAFVPAWLTAAGIKVFSFVTPLAPPLSYMAPGVGGFMVLGVIYMIYLYRTNPGRISDVGLVHLDIVEEVTGE